MATLHHGNTEEPKPAPGALRLVQEFVNTRDLESGTEVFVDEEALEVWMRGARLIGEGVRAGARDLERAIALREALRALLVSNNGDDVDPQAIATLDDLARGLPVSVGFDATGEARLKGGAEGVEGALGYVLGLVLYANADGTWRRLKACGNDDCRWAFYDASKNRVGTWCDMAVCGNRRKSRAHRERQRTGR